MTTETKPIYSRQREAERMAADFISSSPTKKDAYREAYLLGPIAYKYGPFPLEYAEAAHLRARVLAIIMNGADSISHEEFVPSEPLILTDDIEGYKLFRGVGFGLAIEFGILMLCVIGFAAWKGMHS